MNKFTRDVVFSSETKDWGTPVEFFNKVNIRNYSIAKKQNCEKTFPEKIQGDFEQANDAS